MLSTLLSNVAGYFSKYFLATCYLPILTFIAVNAAGAYVAFQPFHDWASEQLLAGGSLLQSALTSTLLALAALAPAFVLSGILDSLRRVLEGKWPDWVAHAFMPAQDCRLQEILKRIGEAAELRVRIEEAVPGWHGALQAARREGETNGATYRAAINPDLRRMIEGGRALRAQNRLVPFELLEQIKAELVREFRRHDWRRQESGRRLLGEYHQAWTDLLGYTRDKAPAEHMRLLTLRNSSFGTDLAPTRMGNVANAIQAYAVRRYSCNLELFWSNLQFSMGKESGANEKLQDAKAKLDFLVACTWLMMTSVAVWVVLLAMKDASRPWFFAVAFGGPVVVYLLYRAALEQYRAFADVTMSSFDMFRFNLLRDMRVPLPSDVEDERRTWDTLHQLANIDEPPEDNLRYQKATPG